MEISRHHEEQIKRKVESGKYGSPDEVLDKALAALEDREQALAEEFVDIEAKLAIADEQSKNGQYTVYDEAGLEDLKERIKRNGRERKEARSQHPS